MTKVDYDFLIAQWKLNQLTDTQVQKAVTLAFITQEQAQTILGTPKA